MLVLLVRVELTRMSVPVSSVPPFQLNVPEVMVGVPASVPALKLNVTEVKASEVLIVPPFRLNVPELKAPDPVTVPPLKLNVLEGRLIWDVAGISNVPAL